MADTLSPAGRSALMRAVRRSGTRPELLVRRLLHRRGFRFSLRRKDLPGRPDIVLPKYSTVVFVHGCFWHQHAGCRKATIPETRKEWWQAKLERNTQRDREVVQELRSLGWKVITVWECELRTPERVLAQLVRQLEGTA